MKRLLACLMAVLIVLGMTDVTVRAAGGNSANVYITIADKDGKLAITQERITVTDIDGDGALTINDALYLAHEAKYDGGAAAGYASEVGAYGCSLAKLWGAANGVSYGYYVNNRSAMSLTDVVKEGDYINAYVYTDLTAWSDTYCYFDVNTVKTEAGKEVVLTLSAAGYDANWQPITVPVNGATIMVDGMATEYKTDKGGKVVITLGTKGTHIISAKSDTQTLVPPACVVNVLADETEAATAPETGDGNNWLVFVSLMIVSGLAVIAGRGKKSYEA